jgi:Protein of unknown function (DUF1415)
VSRVLVRMGICPFTKHPQKSGQGLAQLGIPVAAICYETSQASTNDLCLVLADTWESIDNMLKAGPSATSSILLMAPEYDNEFDLWSGPLFCLLEAGVQTTQTLDSVGIVCFHPLYATPDGTSWPGFGQMHSVPRLEAWWNKSKSDSLSIDEIAAGGAWQRRTPHATINVLRADQLAAAESKRQSQVLYPRNIETLVGREDGVGNKRLYEQLEAERSMQQ